MPAIKLKSKKYSYADYLQWDDANRYELINGVPYTLAAPNRKHQKVSGNLFAALHYFFKDKKCEVYAAPFDIRLADASTPDHEVFTVVQPDISVFCNQNKLDIRGAHGAPDLVIEITSPSTVIHDVNIKLFLYQKFKVKEFWLIDPDNETIHLYLLDRAGRYELVKEYSKKKRIRSVIFPGFSITGKAIFG